MAAEIRTLTSRWVNSYLIKMDEGFILIDTGFRNQRGPMEEALADAGCRPGDLKLILITHGDSDHAGNAAYLRDKYRSKIAAHRGEAAAVERDDMFLSRGKPSLGRRLLKPIVGLFRLREEDRSAPDLFLGDEEGLAEAEGWTARRIGASAITLSAETPPERALRSGPSTTDDSRDR